MDYTTSTPSRGYVKAAGFFYLMIIIIGAMGQIFIRGDIIVWEDASATANNMLANATLWRIGTFGDLAMHLLDIPVMVILYLLLKPTNRNIALITLAFNMIQTAVLAGNKIVLIIPLILLGNDAYKVSLGEEQIHMLVMLLNEIHDYGFGLGLVFFGFACLGYGYLIFKSQFFPRTIGILMIFAGIGYLTNSFMLILAPAYASAVLPLFALCITGELSLSLWLIFKGADSSQGPMKNSPTPNIAH